MCNGEACDKCGAGCWSNVRDCRHDVLERHEEPETEDRSPADAGPVVVGCDLATGADVFVIFCPVCLRSDGRHALDCALWRRPLEVAP